MGGAGRHCHCKASNFCSHAQVLPGAQTMKIPYFVLMFTPNLHCFVIIMPGLWSTLSEIPLYFENHQSGIWNELMIDLISDNVISLQIFLLTSSKVGFGWTGWMQGSHCHTVCPGVVNQLKGHLWFLGNHRCKHCDSLHPCWENLAGWQCQWAERWCRCSLHCLGSCLGRMVRWGPHLGLWRHLHMHQSYRSSGTHLWIHIQAEIQGRSQCSWRRIWKRKIHKW